MGATSGETTRAASQPGRAAPLVALLAAALAVKAVVLAQLHDHPLLQPHGDLDTAYYLELARRVAEGGPLAVREPLFVSPLYVYFLAAILAAGGSPLSVKIVQIVLGTAAVGLVAATARIWFDRRVALLAGTLALLTGLFTFYEVLILQAALDPFLTALALYTVTRAATTERRAGPPLAAGLSLGLLALNRPNALVYGLVVVAGLAARPWLARGPIRPHAPGASRGGLAARGAAACLAGLLLVLVPNALRNLAASGELVPISAHGGLNFYIGNSPGADGTYQRLPGITPSIVGQTRDAMALAEREAGRALSAGEVSDFFYRRAWEWIGAHPGDALVLFVRKLALVVHRVDVPLNYSYAYYSRDERTLLRALAAGAWLLMPLGLVGLFLKSARRPQAVGYWLWASFVPVYGLSVAAFFVSSRYRMPLLVPLCASAAATVLWLAGRLARRERRAAAGVLAAVGAAAILAWWPLRVDDGRGGERTRWAVWLVEQGRVDEALRYVAEVSPGHSHPGVLRFKVGEALAAAGRFDAAIALFGEALAIDRGQPAIHLALGQALVVRNRGPEAIAHLEAAFDAGFRPEVAAPWLARALAQAGRRREAAGLLRRLPESVAAGRVETAADLGALALEIDDPEQAVRWLRLAGTLGPERADVLAQLGAALLLLDRPAEAVGPLERACAMEPTDAAARLNLAVALAALGRVDEARRHAEEARRLDPGEPRAADLLRALARTVERP
jgi:tetratricopeptide (TPR) repeat protein